MPCFRNFFWKSEVETSNMTSISIKKTVSKGSSAFQSLRIQPYVYVYLLFDDTDGVVRNVRSGVIPSSYRQLH